MRLRALLAGLGLATVSVTAAPAQDLCSPLTRLLMAPPSGFVAERVAPDREQRWVATPVTAHAICEVSETQAKNADALRCTINDRAAAADVSAFYQANLEIIDRCLAGLQRLQPWQRAASKVEIEGLRGVETTWVHDTDALYFKISLADYLRTATNSSYNSFVVEYLKY